MGSYNVYAEVRGKYARPAPVLNKAVKNYELNPVLSRPSTAGSLRPRSEKAAFDGNKLEKKEKKELLTEKFYRPVTPTKVRSGSMNKTRKSFYYAKIDDNSVNSENFKKDFDDKEVEKANIFDENEEKIEDGIKEQEIEEIYEKTGENIENIEKNDDENSHVQKVGFKDEQQTTLSHFSKASWKTTSSQRRYIQELESLLREEKLKRIQLEEKFNQISSK